MMQLAVDMKKAIKEIQEAFMKFPLKYVPLSYLFLSYKFPETENISEDFHIEFGYTYQDARIAGLSTKLRKLTLLYAYDKNLSIVSTEAIAWGSQKASERAGIPRMGKTFKRSIQLNKLPNNLLKQLIITNPGNNPLTKVKKTMLKNTGHRHGNLFINKNIVNRYYSGNIPLNVYGNGNDIELFNFGDDVYGTHFKRMKNRHNEAKRTYNRL